MEHRFRLKPYLGKSTRYRCPNCEKDKTFCKYVDTETGEYLDPNVGRCNRESKCGYHYTPKQYFLDNGNSFPSKPQEHFTKSKEKAKPKTISFFPVEVFKQSLQSYEGNNFVIFLINLFGRQTTEKLISQYFIASSKRWQGATVFWQVDVNGKIRTGKIMLYCSDTGKRIKEPFNHINWAHKSLPQPDYRLKQCLFGEHLLRKEPNKIVALVESEKTAVIASVYFPQFIWLAVGSLSNLTAEKCQVLTGRNIVLFPDLNGYDKWVKKAEQLAPSARICVSDLLESKALACEREQGLDLADYLIQFNPEALIGTTSKQTSQACIEIDSLDKEYYHYSFDELIKEVGTNGALQKVEQYKQLAAQYASCSTYVIHHCPLLSTYQQVRYLIAS